MMEYKYYKIIRKHDNYTSYCSTLNFIYEYFSLMYGSPTLWIAGDDKVTIKSRKDEIQIPLKIEVETDDYTFDVVLSKGEIEKVQLREIV